MKNTTSQNTTRTNLQIAQGIRLTIQEMKTSKGLKLLQLKHQLSCLKTERRHKNDHLCFG